MTATQALVKVTMQDAAKRRAHEDDIARAPRLRKRVLAPSSLATHDRWSGAPFPIPMTMSEQFERLSRYPIVALSTGALYAVALAGYPDPRKVGQSKRRPALDEDGGVE